MAFLSSSTGSLFDFEGLKVDFRVVALLAFIVACTMDFVQLVFVFVGIITYATVQTLTIPANFKADKGSSKMHKKCVDGDFTPSRSRRTPSPPVCKEPVSKPETSRQPSSQPVAAPTFSAEGWDAEVDELLEKISPTQRSERIVQELARFVKETLAPLIPEVEVLGFASGDFSTGTAFRVAVPEVDIVLRVDPHVLSSRLRGRDPQGASQVRVVDMSKLQKSAIRICTDRLVATGHCKFRRSAFRGPEPKVTLLVPTSLGIHDEAIPIDLSINSTSPFRNAALLAQCERLEPRARALALLVRRWAKDRGLCHAAKGHLSPYAWTLLAVYFLQVSDDCKLLPPLKGPEMLEDGAPMAAAVEAVPRATEQQTVGQLFRAFAAFYTNEFNFRNEAISVRRGTRAPPDVSLPLHIVLHDDGVSTSVAPSVEDPFDRRRNLSGDTTAPALLRMKEELGRAHQLCSQGASLSELLEPWVPAEHTPELEE